jgi:small subunit ribosomal protein S20
MANKKAAKKDIITNTRNRDRNKHYKTLLKTFIKKALAAIEAKTSDADALIKDAIKQVDKTVSKGILHKNTAARKKSSLAKKLTKA